MTNSTMIIQDVEAQCPVCHNKMKQLAHRDYYCENCQQKYKEEYICPACEKQLEQVKGCGSINYLCKIDGLISSSKVKFHYQKTKF